MKNCPACAAAGPKPRGGLLRCAACGLAWAEEPRFSEAVYAAGLEDAIYSGAKRRLFAEALDFLEGALGRPGALLDAGCATGELLKAAAARGWAAEGLEYSPALLAGAAAAGLKVRAGALESARLPAGAYDAATAFEVLSQVSDPAAAAASLYAALKPGGLLYIREFNASFHLPLAGASLFGARPAVLHNFNFTPAALRALLARAGFREVRVRNSRPTSGDPYRSGGRLGGVLTGALKVLYYWLAQAAWALSLGGVFAGPALIVTARK